MLNIVIFGPPGAGKGTQSSKLIEKYQLKHLSTGDLLRSEMAAGSELGMLAKQYMDSGTLVPDSVVIGMIENQLKNTGGAKGIIFDGFPRTIPQAEALDALLAEYNAPIKGVLSLEVTEQELIARILERGKTSGRADDQNVELVQNRVREYNLKTAPVASYYSAQGKVHSVHGIGSLEEIFEGLCAAIDAFSATPA